VRALGPPPRPPAPVPHTASTKNKVTNRFIQESLFGS